MVYKQGSDILESYSYLYDKNGNIIRKTEVNNTPEAVADYVNKTRQYTYDTLGRLVKTVITDHLDNDAQQTITYEYDKAGNRTKKTKGSTEIVYTYNGLDQLLTAVTNRGGVEAGTATYTYDANGNQVKEVNTDNLMTTVNVYDAENRLSKVTRTSQASAGTEETFVQENLYNGDGQRVQKKEGAKVTNYFYQDGVVSYTTNANDDVKVIQNLLGLEGNIILAEKKLETVDETDDSHNYYLYNKDIQGSTVNILDENGAGELSYTYDDFGETEIHGNSSFENEICYTGGVCDASTGLYYLNARYYDPATGRFLTEDTYRGELEEPDTLYLYAYCKNNPVNYVDPSGHAWVKFSTISKRAKKGDRKAKQVISRYNGNVKRDKKAKYKGNTKSRIYKQYKLTHIYFRTASVSKNGCGIIAIHNLINLKGKSKNFLELVAEFDYKMLSSGITGIMPSTVKAALDVYVPSRNMSGVGSFDKNLKTYGILLYTHSRGAHYVAVSKKGNKRYLYNYNNDYPIRTTTSTISKFLKNRRYGYLGGYVVKR